MRIITGKARGTNLVSLPGLTTRPTIDRVKEAIFSAIQFEIYGAKVLDLFSGSGQLGLEALSRGAAEAVMVDCCAEAIKVIRENIKRANLAQGARVLQNDWRNALLSLKGEKTFRFVFLDPPYESGVYEDCVHTLMEMNLVDQETQIIMECDAGNRPKSEIDDFILVREKKFGTVGVNIYRHRKWEGEG